MNYLQISKKSVTCSFSYYLLQTSRTFIVNLLQYVFHQILKGVFFQLSNHFISETLSVISGMGNYKEIFSHNALTAGARAKVTPRVFVSL